MPIIKSAKKRVRTAEKAKTRNKETKSSLRASLKAFTASLSTKKNVDETTAKAHSELDKAVKKGLIHKNKAARTKKQMAAASQKAGVKPSTTKKPTAKKAATPKATPKKSAPAKKTATKKPTKK